MGPPSYPGGTPPPYLPGPPNRPEAYPGAAGKRSGRGKGPALVVGAMLLATAIVWGLVVVNSGDRTDVSANTAPSVTTTAAPPTTTETTTPEPDPEEQLLELVPVEFSEEQCGTRELAGDGDIASVECGESRTQPGPTQSRFYLYEDSEQVAEVFEADMAEFGLAQLPVGTFDCTANAGYATWAYDASGGRDGYYACRIIAEQNLALIQWTEDEYHFYGVVAVSGGAAELAQLWEWWKAHSAVSAS